MDTWRGKGFLVHSTFTEADRKRGQEVRMKQKGQRVRAQQKASREEQAMLERGRAVRQKQAAERATQKIKEAGRRVRLNQKAQREWEAKTQRAVAQERSGRRAAGYSSSVQRMTATDAYNKLMKIINDENWVGNLAVAGLAGGSDYDKLLESFSNRMSDILTGYMENYGLTYDDAMSVAQSAGDAVGTATGNMIVSMRAEQQRQLTPSQTYDPATGMWW